VRGTPRAAGLHARHSAAPHASAADPPRRRWWWNHPRRASARAQRRALHSEGDTCTRAPSVSAAECTPRGGDSSAPQCHRLNGRRMTCMYAHRALRRRMVPMVRRRTCEYAHDEERATRRSLQRHAAEARSPIVRIARSSHVLLSSTETMTPEMHSLTAQSRSTCAHLES
jgi:hypothetical protein